jgi:uncharacterized membrane protein YjdF
MSRPVGGRTPRFPLTPLVYRPLVLHALILMVGGHYTYAEVPLTLWVRDALGLARNDYDRLGHFALGVVPALLAREILLLRTLIERRRCLLFVVCVCLVPSVLYEAIETRGSRWRGPSSKPPRWPRRSAAQRIRRGRLDSSKLA